MVSRPKANARPQVYIRFIDLPRPPGLRHEGVAFRKFEFKGMVNGGYVIRAQLVDSHSSLLRSLVKRGYMKQARNEPIRVEFQIKWHSDAKPRGEATEKQLAYVCSLEARGGPHDKAVLEFVAIDPPSWHLNAGDGAGSAFKGRVSDAIKQVVAKYAPGVDVRVSQTVDSKENYWYMMRQDPKTFIGSLIDWSSSVTRNKTHWLVVPDGNANSLTIKEQAELRSKRRAYYRYHHGSTHDTIKDWSFLADNALSLSNSKLITSGLSAVSGQYLDRVTDGGEGKVYVKDSTTPAKVIADVTEEQSYRKPPDGGPPGSGVAGWTHVTSVPEMYSAGDVGLRYEEYIDGRPRGMYLNMLNLLFRAKFRVVGHGEWSNCEGLGVDTFYVKWLGAPGADGSEYFLTGNWLVYGFHHTVTRKFWYTDLYGARFDHDAAARKAGG